nr:RNA-directed DNA polymerase, eukaryota [Tanacetum cinerariifolium]
MEEKSVEMKRECNVYGTVVDVFIPFKKSNAGKRFAFVHFIKVFNLDRLMKNLCTIWIGRHHLYANQTLLNDEGFMDVKLLYLGGMWVMFKFDKEVTKANTMKHTRGETLNIEDTIESSFGRKWLCIITKHHVSIMESFKIIVKGKVFMVRAKELFTWNPNFLAHKEMVYSSDDESVHGEKHKAMQSHLSEEEADDYNASDVDGVAKTIIDDNSMSPKNYSGDLGKQHSDDPFELYDLLKMKKSGVEIRDVNGNMDNEFLPLINAKVMTTSQVVQEEVPSDVVGMSVATNGGSVLGVLEDVIFVGKAMGYSMEGCEKDVESIIENQGDEADYLSILLGHWNGEAILMGDFNEVRSRDERRGSWFNPSSARVFDHFISSSSLVDVKMEGYAFMWSHPSATKMSKLDRFLVSDGVFLLFPSITALCLDRYLLDHHPILLREVDLDFGLISFWFYHSWFSFVGFDEMVEQTWRSFSHSDRNEMIRFKKKLQELKNQGVVSDTFLFRRHELKRQLHNIKAMEVTDSLQKSKVRWAIKGDENSKRLSFYALNRAFLLKWVWRFVSQDGSLGFRVIQALYGPMIDTYSVHKASNWCSIMREVHLLKMKGFDFLSHCNNRMGDGNNTRFWLDIWKGDKTLRDAFPRMFALESVKQISMAEKMVMPVDYSFLRPVRGGIEQQQFTDLASTMDSVSLSSSHDRWVCNLSGDGKFTVKEVRNFIDDLFLPSHPEPTIWVKYIPIKINIFVWRARRDYLPTRVNLICRGVTLESSNCPLCLSCEEDVHHFFSSVIWLGLFCIMCTDGGT